MPSNFGQFLAKAGNLLDTWQKLAKFDSFHPAKKPIIMASSTFETWSDLGHLKKMSNFDVSSWQLAGHLPNLVVFSLANFGNSIIIDAPKV